MADVLKKVPVREQEPKVRATNFEEVCYGYNKEEAMEEATRCLNCKNARCIQGCPVSINIPAFIAQIKDGNIEEAYKVIGQSSALPAICGRVCPQESQCESKCVRGIKGDAVSIGKLERFVADYALENDIKPEKPEKTNGHKVAVIGSGPSGLTCAGDLAKLGYEVTVFEALHELGGVLVYGIPEFRLPKQKVVKKEIEKVKELGVKFETNVVIGKSVKIDELMEKEGFEVVFLTPDADGRVPEEAVLKAVLLDGKIDLDISQFVAQGNHGRLAADAVSENGGQGLGHIGNFRDVVHERLAADGIERIIQEMRVDLLVQQLKLHFPLLTLLTDKPVCRRANGGDHAVKFLGKNAHLIVRPDREMHIPVSLFGSRNQLCADRC